MSVVDAPHEYGYERFRFAEDLLLLQLDAHLVLGLLLEIRDTTHIYVKSEATESWRVENRPLD